MTKIQYISLILLLIFVTSLINIFYKPWLFDIQFLVPNAFSPLQGTGVTISTSSLYGYKCPSEQVCDCGTLNGDLVSFQVLENESIYVMDRQLTPGTYCVPRGVGNCNQRTSFQIFSSTGWHCVPRTYNPLACKSDEALDNSQNRVWDYVLQKEVTQMENPYELMKDGKTLRYRCKCDSLDAHGRHMVSSLPFVCSVDYCIKEFPKVLPGMGFTGTECNCLLYNHKNPLDKKSPCVNEYSRVENGKLLGRVDCTSNISLKKHAIFCPPTDGVLKFETKIETNLNIANYLHKMVFQDTI